MRFLYPTGGTDGRYGTMIGPDTYGVGQSVKDGKPWACDNGAFSKGFNLAALFSKLEVMLPYRDTCLFVAVPDSVGNWVETKDRYRWCAWQIKAMGFPVAYVAQDGSENQGLPPEYDALFIGGSTDWKVGPGAIKLIQAAQLRGKHIHIGRVNWWKRYHHFRSIQGSDHFTCDGTRPRFDGIEKTIEAWTNYENKPVQIRFTLPNLDPYC